VAHVRVLTSLKQHLITENLAEHRAVEAWQRFGGDARRVDAVEVLKEKKPKKSRVYRLLGAGPGGLSVIAKRCRTATAGVERAMYERVLSCLPAPHLRCYGSIPDPASGQEWIFLEDAGDTEVGEDELGDVVGWLGRFHTSAAAAARSAGAELPDRGLAYHLGHMDSAHRDLRAGLDMPEFAGEDRRLLVATLEFARGRRTLLAAV